MRPGRLWPAAVVGVLAVTVLANLVILRLASDPDAAAVEPDYYRKAVAWDSLRALEERGEQLGWRLDLELSPLPAGARRVTLHAEDRGRAPLEGAVVGIEAIHNRHAARHVRVELAPVPGTPGTYAGELAPAYPGTWELRADVERGDGRVLRTFRREVREETGP